MRHSGLPAVILLPAVAVATVAIAAAAVIATTVIGRAAVVDRAAAVIVAGAVIVAVGIIVIAAAIGSGDRNAGADDAGEGSGCGSAATPIIPAAGAEIGGVTRAGSGRQTLLLRRSCDSQRRLDRRQRQRRHRRQRSGAAD